MTATLERYRQVWRTWTHWPVFRVLIWLMLAEWLVGLTVYQLGDSIVSLGAYVDFYDLLVDIVSGMIFFCTLTPILLAVAVPILIVWRVRQQMTDWRSALTPHHRRMHLLVGASIFASIFILMVCLPAFLDLLRGWWDYLDWTAGIALSPRLPNSHADPFVFQEVSNAFHYSFGRYMQMDGWRTINVVAWVLFAMTLIGWATAWVSPWLALASSVMVATLIVCFGPGNMDQIINFVSQEPRLIVLLLVVDALLQAGLWTLLASLSVGRDSIQADERVPWLSKVLVGLKPQMPGTLMTAGIWRRADHRRRMGLGRRFIWTVAVFIGALIFLSPVLDSYSDWLARGGFAFSALVTCGIICALCIGLSWPQRFAVLNEVELLRPAPREACAREMGLAMLWDAAELSAAMLLIMFIPIGFWSPAVFTESWFWNAVAAVILGQALVFGAIAWTMLLRSAIASMIALALSILAGALLVHFAMDDRWLLPALLAGGAGIILTLHAYHRWLRADLI